MIEKIHYIHIYEIYDRLCRFDLPEGEAFFMHKKNHLFSTVGVTFKDAELTFFDVYTPDENHYLHIQRMFKEAVECLESPLEIKEWNDEDQGSTGSTQIFGDVGCGGSTSGSAVAN